MFALEGFVRPFQSPPLGVPFALPNQGPSPNIILSYGRSGRGRQFPGSFNRTITFYMKKYVNETRNSQ